MLRPAWLLLAALAIAAVCGPRGVGGSAAAGAGPGRAGAGERTWPKSSGTDRKTKSKKVAGKKSGNRQHKKHKKANGLKPRWKKQNKRGKTGRKKLNKGKKSANNRHKKNKKAKEPKLRRKKPHIKRKKPSKKKKKKAKHRSKSHKNLVSRRAYSCNGTSLGDTCLTNLISALKFERDKIRTFTNQKKRAESFKKIIGKKGGKDGIFGNTTTYLLLALGGNVTGLNCSGRASMTTEAAATYTTLANCSTAVPAACSLPNTTANFTLLDACKATYSAIQTKNAACLALQTDGAAACTCWAAAVNLTSTAKRLAKDCDSQTMQQGMLAKKKTCLAAFGKCKKAEDSSVGYIMTCSQDSTASATRGRRGLPAELAMARIL